MLQRQPEDTPACLDLLTRVEDIKPGGVTIATNNHVVADQSMDQMAVELVERYLKIAHNQANFLFQQNKFLETQITDYAHKLHGLEETVITAIKERRGLEAVWKTPLVTVPTFAQLTGK